MTEEALDAVQRMQLAELRKTFPAEQINKLPKPKSKDAQKGKCPACGGWHGLPANHIDYVGHAELTSRLLDVDPWWNWEPAAWTEDGEPKINVRGNTARMWIKLTVAGVTRLGVGTCSANKDDVEKELIGDALRNAAMRFGAALDLWSKSERHRDDSDGSAPKQGRSSGKAKRSEAAPARQSEPEGEATHNLTSKMTEKVAGPDRQAFITQLKDDYDVLITKVPESKREAVEKLIESWSAERPFSDDV
jgi:hypothetical protein